MGDSEAERRAADRTAKLRLRLGGGASPPFALGRGRRPPSPISPRARGGMPAPFSPALVAAVIDSMPLQHAVTACRYIGRSQG